MYYHLGNNYLKQITSLFVPDTCKEWWRTWQAKLIRLAVVPLTHLPFSEHSVVAEFSEPAEYCQEAEIFLEGHHLPYNVRGKKIRKEIKYRKKYFALQRNSFSAQILKKLFYSRYSVPSLQGTTRWLVILRKIFREKQLVLLQWRLTEKKEREKDFLIFPKKIFRI